MVLSVTGFLIAFQRRLWRTGMSSSAAALMLAMLIAAFYNVTFWQGVVSRLTEISLNSVGFVLAFYSLLTLLVFILFLPFLHTRLFKPFACFLIFACATMAYFNHMGVVIDDAMMKNIAETDSREALELLNPTLLLWLFLLALLPIYFVFKLKINYLGWWLTSKKSSVIVAAFVGFLTLLAFTNFQFITFFGRENRDLRLYVNPVYPIISLRRFAEDQFKSTPQFTRIGLDAQQIKFPKKPRTVGIFVVGETARADHFSINGYGKKTTPHLMQRLETGQLVNFNQATSCGTITAYSVPCMFSMLDAKDFSVRKASEQSNVLDILEQAGIKTVWRDNNSSCKGVCARIENENFRDAIDKKSIYYHEGEYLDEVLLSNLNTLIDSTDKDILIVLHQLGSHGPAYHRRYPASFAHFQPSCSSNSPQDCTPEEVNNSYDNTILYTDYVLNKTIELLEAHSDQYQSFMLYASDHGESLGENGVYLHGLPKVIAPEAQTHIPMMVWMSDAFAVVEHLAADINSDCTGRSVSHDNIAPTLLSFFSVNTSLKKPEQNIINTSCQRGQVLVKK